MARMLRTPSRQATLTWTYAPRPLARPYRSSVPAPSGVRTSLISSPFPASWRQATQVLTGVWRAFAIGVAGLDVDPEPGQLGSKARILTVAADRQGKLVFGHEHRRGPGHPVDG